MRASARTLALILAIGLLATLCVGIVAAEETEFDVLRPSTGTETFHWWEEALWKSSVDLNGRKIEVKYTGTYALVNYFKFVNVETGESIVFTDFDQVVPSDAVRMVSDIKSFTKEDTQWAIRTDHMGDVGGKSLHAMVGQELPNLVYDLKLSGKYAIYVGMRATDFTNEIALRVVD